MFGDVNDPPLLQRQLCNPSGGEWVNDVILETKWRGQDLSAHALKKCKSINPVWNSCVREIFRLFGLEEPKSGQIILG